MKEKIMGLICFKWGNEPDWYADGIASDIDSYLDGRPKASDDEVVKALSTTWSEFGIRYYLQERRAMRKTLEARP